MNDPAPMQSRQRVEDCVCHDDRLVDRQRPALEARGDCLALQQFHHQKRLAAILIELIERADVGVAHASGRARLAAEALERNGIGDDLRTNDLDRHVTIQPIVMRRIDHAHAALAERASDAIPANSLRHDPLILQGASGQEREP